MIINEEEVYKNNYICSNYSYVRWNWNFFKRFKPTKGLSEAEKIEILNKIKVYDMKIFQNLSIEKLNR